MGAGEGVERLVVGLEQGEIAEGNHGALVPERDQALVKPEHAPLAREVVGHVDMGAVRVDGQPRGADSEAGLRRGVPLHGGARVVAAHGLHAGEHGAGVQIELLHGLAVVVERLEVAVVVDGVEAHVGHADLLALIDVGRAAVQVQHQRPQRRRLVTPGGVVAEARHQPGLVVVVQVEAVPAGFGQSVLPAGQAFLQCRQVAG